MSSEVAIRATRLAKAFPVYARPHHRLLQMLSPGPANRWYREFHALRDVSFEIPRGQTVGIVGRNGSGKSTLLQVLCGTLSASAGDDVAAHYVAQHSMAAAASSKSRRAKKKQ